MTRLKAHVLQISHSGEVSKESKETVQLRIAGYNTVTGKETSPTDNCTIYIDDPAQFHQLQNGGEYFLDFVEIQRAGLPLVSDPVKLANDPGPRQFGHKSPTDQAFENSINQKNQIDGMKKAEEDAKIAEARRNNETEQAIHSTTNTAFDLDNYLKNTKKD